MASSEQLKALIKSHINRDEEQFYSVAMQVAAHEAKVGHGKLAQELRDMIDAAKAHLLSSPSGKLISLAKPRGELAHLLSVTYPSIRLADMVLNDKVSAQLQRIVKEQRLFARIREHGLSPRRKLLLVGPSGTGKTMTASALAGELGVPLFSVRLDALITKFMGETAAKLRQVFDAISDVRGVYFFDEFDAIGSHRNVSNDVGEIRRVLNSFLQMIEHDQSNSLILAATNYPDVLDYALFRRFDDVIEYDVPTVTQAAALLGARLGNFAPKPFERRAFAAEAKGLSYAEICRAVDESIKEAIMHDQARIEEATLLRAFHERRMISNKLADDEPLSNHAGTAKR